MSTDHDWNQQHQETLQNIPWFVTGRLSSAETAAAAVHIALCTVCQQELESQRHIRELMLAPDPLEVAPQASFHKLRSRIEEMEREMPAEAAAATQLSSPVAAAVVPAAGARAPGWLRPLLLGQLAASVLAASLLLWSAVDHWTAPRFQTASSAPMLALPGPALRVVAAPGVTVAEFGALLRDSQAQVVEGPNAQNAWTVAMPAGASSAARDALLAGWHADARILFAEPVARAAAP